MIPLRHHLYEQRSSLGSAGFAAFRLETEVLEMLISVWREGEYLICAGSDRALVYFPRLRRSQPRIEIKALHLGQRLMVSSPKFPGRMYEHEH